MNRLSIGSAVAVFTFLLGVFAVAGWLMFGQIVKQLEFTDHQAVPPVPISSEEPLTFKPTFRACKPGWAQGYEASDGSELVEWASPFDSEADAKAGLESVLKNAATIISRSDIFDKAGNKIGETVTASLSPDEFRKEERVAVMQLNGLFLRGIHAASLRHIFEFQATSFCEMK